MKQAIISSCHRPEDSACFSACGRYRYRLDRHWDRAKPPLGMIGLNPSIAGGEQNDPTIRREIGFAHGHGFGGLIKGNLFAFVSTDPMRLRQCIGAAVGPDCDRYLGELFEECSTVIAAWGAPHHLGEPLLRRVNDVLAIAKSYGHAHLYCLGTTKDGYPRHPLYLPKTAKLAVWRTT